MVLYCEEKSASSVFASVVGSTLNFIGDRLDAVFSSVQKGSHATVTHEEAKRYVIYTYVIVGDLLLLTEDQLSNAVPIREESLAIVGDGEILEATKAKV